MNHDKLAARDLDSDILKVVYLGLPYYDVSFFLHMHYVPQLAEQPTNIRNLHHSYIRIGMDIDIYRMSHMIVDIYINNLTNRRKTYVTGKKIQRPIWNQRFLQ